MKGERALARKRWQAVADAEFDRDLLLWVANVAANILKADDALTDNERRAALLKAVGLGGRLDPHQEAIRAIVADVDHTCELIERGSRWAPARPLRKGEQAARRRDAVAAQLNLGHLTVKELNGRIRLALRDD